MFPDALAVDEGTIRTIEVFDIGHSQVRVDSRMMTADSGIVDDEIIIRGPAYSEIALA